MKKCCDVCTADKAALKCEHARISVNTKSKSKRKKTPDEIISRFDVIRNMMKDMEVQNQKKGRRKIFLPHLLKSVVSMFFDPLKILLNVLSVLDDVFELVDHHSYHFL
jgi:hypothetical protein